MYDSLRIVSYLFSHWSHCSLASKHNYIFVRQWSVSFSIVIRLLCGIFISHCISFTKIQMPSYVSQQKMKMKFRKINWIRIGPINQTVTWKSCSALRPKQFICVVFMQWNVSIKKYYLARIINWQKYYWLAIWYQWHGELCIIKITIYSTVDLGSEGSLCFIIQYFEM